MNSDFEIHGHRGCRGLMPENTIAGFAKAIEMGIDAIEMDIVVTRDKQLLVSHEPWMRADLCLFPNGKKITESEERDLNLYEMGIDTIKLYDCGSLKQANFPSQQNSQHTKPLFREVVEAVQGKLKKYKCRLNIEIKSERFWYGEYQPDLSEYCEIIIKELKPIARVKGRFIIQSFDTSILNKLHKEQPEWEYGLLLQGKIDLQKEMERLTFLPDYLNLHFDSYDESIVNEIHEKEIKTLAWTVNDVEIGKNLLEMGIDGVISDYPNLFLEVKQKL